VLLFQCKEKNNDTVHIRMRAQLEPEQQKIYSLLGVNNHSGNVVKATIQTK